MCDSGSRDRLLFLHKVLHDLSLPILQNLLRALLHHHGNFHSVPDQALEKGLDLHHCAGLLLHDNLHSLHYHCHSEQISGTGLQ